MTCPEAVMRPVALAVTHTPAWFWGVFRLLVWQGAFSSALAARRLRLRLRLRLRKALKKLAPVQNTSRSLANQD